MGDERCNYNYGKLKASKGNDITEFKVVSFFFKFAIHLDCSGNLVDKSTPSHKFYKTFLNNIEKEMCCEMNIDNGGWIVRTINFIE